MSISFLFICFYRWKTVIHGCIDGYSRLMVFLSASNRNIKEVVSSKFVCALSIYGVPSRLRVDQGGENNDACLIMDLLRGTGRGSSIRGQSTNNQRIERSWVDTWNGVTNVYYDFFHFLENLGILDPDEPVHIWALHFVFIPRLNRDLELFRCQWNNHPLRTEHHMTPNQLFVKRSLELSNTNLTAMVDLFQPRQDAPTNGSEDLVTPEWTGQQVHVPHVSCPIAEDDLDRLKLTIDPLDDTMGDLGKTLFNNVLQFILDCQN